MRNPRYLSNLAQGVETAADLLGREHALRADRAALRAKRDELAALEDELGRLADQNPDLDDRVRRQRSEVEAAREKLQSLRDLAADLERENAPQLSRAIEAIWQLLPRDEFDERSPD
jgi:predicted RNase H-like nuclease (RuvC/YqgF family)